MSQSGWDLPGEVKQRQADLIALRRDFHRHAELSLKETRTATVIAERLHAAGLDVRTGLAGGTGVVGILRGDKPGPVVAWRADIDALPLVEAVKLPFASIHEGAMHACGHDGHTAIGLVLADLFAAHRRELAGTIVFIFQPGEEVLTGAQSMIADGVLEQPHVDAIFGLHLHNQREAGTVNVCPGPSMASADFFDIEVIGKGGHGAFPHLSVDPLTVAAHIVIGMQSLVSREVAAQDPAVLTVGEMHGGTKHNIIPETAVLRGSLRTYSESVRDQVVERLGAFAARIAQAHRAEARLRLVGLSVPPLVNREPWAGRIYDEACAEMGAHRCTQGPQVMATEDMALFLNQRPGCFFRVGAAPGPGAAPHHSPGFELNEDGLAVGVRVGVRALLAGLQHGAG